VTVGSCYVCTSGWPAPVRCLSEQGLQGQDNLTHREYKEDTSPGVEQNFIDNKKK